jgi:hypothetical protein
MSKANNLEEESAEQQRAERRPYEAPTVKDFFQPLVVLGTGPTPTGSICASPKRPKH